MFRNYLKIAWRNLIRDKGYSAINIFGLALGMACALLIGLWVRDELSYDRFLPDVDNIHHIRVNYNFRGQGLQTTLVTPGPLQEVIAKEVPQVAAITKLTWRSEALITVKAKTAKERGHYATTDFFSVFNLPALYGDPAKALANLNQIVITRKVAEKFFPNGLALGKTLQLNNDKFFIVGAVIENLPATSSLQFDWLVNWEVQEQPWQKTWGNNSFLTYCRLKSETTVEQTEVAMKGIYPRYADFDNNETPILQPITDLHLWGDYKNGKPVGGQIEYVRIFSLVALFILFIACINFMNVATARSAMRAKEVGVRKSLGAMRSSLAGQFLSESLLTSALAAGLALLIVWNVLPTFNAVFEKQLTFGLTEPAFWPLLGGIVFVTGLVSGSYPALFLSGLSPVRILRGRGPSPRLRLGTGPAQFRRVLVVFQFSLSIFLIVGMLAVGRQMNYLRTKHLGLDRENVVWIQLEGNIAGFPKTETFRRELLQQPGIASAVEVAHLPINIQSTSTDLQWPGKDPNQLFSVSAMSVGADFVKTMNIQLLAGRDFRAGSYADTSNYLINEAAAKLMGMKEPVGKEITFWMGKGRVIGLMKDFHLNSLHQAISPLVLTYIPGNTSFLLVKTNPGQTQRAVTSLEKVARSFNPNYPFTYHFLDEDYEELYRSEQQVQTLVNYFGVLAILISCLGLFGLAAFTAEQRTKEIGVRKVLGASVGNIVTLLSKDFLKLVLFALVLASPLAWWALDKWLSTFAYRQQLSGWYFALAGTLAVSIALLTVSYQSIKAALMNPVKSLRSE
ncbi:ABC transporter permease [Spirosoma montaniterrae]|uniref:ABC transporter permease n=1 Tax=Spirosoma montaniterrae TaxID=1178516 RepID=A0A1P9X0A4_9BACT|nr:ABC transporter permease [Spirosoma montaniterrae]AQG81067.1 hypothetical protein AWR27_18120 [Spirosoma montaniterrae]